MKSKKALNLFTSFLILFTSVSLTASGQEKDSIKYSIKESKAVVDAYLNALRLIAHRDSCEQQLLEFKAIIKNDSIEKAADNKTDAIQDKLVEAYKEKDQKNEKAFKRSEFWRRFWKTTAGILSVPAALEIYRIAKE